MGAESNADAVRGLRESGQQMKRIPFQQIWAAKTTIPWPPIGYQQAAVLPLMFETMEEWTRQFDD